MKIKELWIEDYKLLQDFNITFDEQLVVLIGQNGSGKSTLLEFVANIFYDLYEHFVLGKKIKMKFDFKLRYEIEYEYKLYKLYITYIKDIPSYDIIRVAINGNTEKYTKSIINKEFNNGYKDILPQNIVMYYSGISETLANKFKLFQDKYFITPAVKNSTKLEQPFFYFLPENFSTILIGLLSYQYRVPEILKEQFSIDGFKNIIITLKEPYWKKNTIENIWGADGDLASFLARMTNAVGDNQYEITDKNIIFNIPSQEKLTWIWENYGEEKSIFEYLTTLQANDLIENIEIIINKDGEEISHNDLSEGEKQLLTILGLKELLSTENTLFLLDEPDTYLHPKWQKDFVKELLKSDIKNQFITTTHSPLILGYLKKQYVRIIRDGKIDEDTHYSYGRDINSILLDLMDVTKRPKEVEEKITSLFTDLENENIKEATIKLDELKEYFGEKDNIIIEADTILSFLEE